MTGVSYMIPFVAAGGLLIALGFLLAGYDVANLYEKISISDYSLWNLPGNEFVHEIKNSAGDVVGTETITVSQSGLLLYIGWTLFLLGQAAMSFLVPALAGYISFGLAGRPGIAPGFVMGVVAVQVGAGFIGGLVGSSMLLGYLLTHDADGTLALVQWDKIGEIAISWVLSPMLGGLVSYVLFYQVKKHVLDYNEEIVKRLKEVKAERKAYKEEHRLRFEALPEQERLEAASAMARDAQIYGESDFDPDELESAYYKGLYVIEQRKSSIDAYKALHSWVPLISAGGGMMIASMLIFKGLKNLNLGLGDLVSYLTILMIGAGIWLATFIYAKTLKRKDLAKSTFLLFSWMQVFTAAGFAFSHGANDIANAIGPFAAIMDVLRTDRIGVSAPVPSIVLLTFGIALIVGLWFIGKEVIATVGTSLAEMHPASGFTAELSAASVVMAASMLGLPVSSTHILVGAVLGIGLVNRNANWKAMKPIALAWVITLPAASLLSVLCFFGLQTAFG